MDAPVEPPPPPPQPGPEKSWAGHMQSGAFWMISLRWAVRLTGLVSTVILARLLSPHDFGIVAMAMIVVGSLEILNQTGQKLALIRLPNPTRDDYDSAWTTLALTGALIALAILAIAPFTEDFFNEPRAVLVMQCLALRALLGGLENIGTVDFRRDLKFDRFFAYNVYPKMISFAVTIALAFALRNYWALVAGMLTAQVVQVALSYIMHPHRPRFTLSRAAGLWSFSSWTFIREIGVYLHAQIDQIAVASTSGSDAMGRYSVAADVSASPSREVNDPMIAVLYPVMSRLQDNKAELREVYLRTLAWSALICASAGAGVALVSEDMAALVLGAKWAGIGPLMAWLALGAAVMGLSSGAYALFDALGLPHLGAGMIWVRVGVLAAAVIPTAIVTYNLEDIAIVRLVAAAVFLPGLLLTVGALMSISAVDYVRTLWRPLAAATIMAVAVVLLNTLPIWGNLRLALDIVVGALAFNVTLFVFWSLSGRPASPESDILAVVALWITSIRSRAGRALPK